ncbi:Pfs domain-containing protein [Fusarium globosum]|uniref:Pfs domain-containing protein n=1 Tax=Fusarium globosum TaxID=78864 RepID=A0A8H5YCU0_9HYPO|nr:Pfs domain-containing protein [Fusarium globosum]
MGSEGSQWRHSRRCEDEDERNPEEGGNLRTTPPYLETPACDARFSMTAKRASSAPPVFCAVSMYRYSPLPDGCIRLLRLIPHLDEHAPIQGQLFDYPLLGSGKGTHLYEALSYVWGSETKPQSVCTDNGCLPITTNLHMALKRLRDCSLVRIIWVDAICINQDDTEERSRQVQSMAKIYAKASRVVVWLEEATADSSQAHRDAATDSDRALQGLCVAADGQSTKSLDPKTSQQAIRSLLQRSWFRRIWVLQEVAAARQVLIMCRSAEIDGYAFCTGLNASNLTSQDSNIQSRIRSAAYLIKGAILRPKYATSRSDKFSLDIRPLGELIDMYHNRKATDRRDKVYALFGMSTDVDDFYDFYRSAGLPPYYKILWKDLFHQLVKFLLSEQASVETWEEKEIAVIRSDGCILGEVSSVESVGDWNDRQTVDIKYTRGYMFQKKAWSCRWAHHATANSIRKGDVVCLLQGASKPTIIRLYEDYCAVIAIAVTPTDDERIEGLDIDFHRDFLLIWDWEGSWETLGDERGYECLLSSRVSKHAKTELENYPDKAARLRNIGLILGDLEKYEEAENSLQKAMRRRGDYAQITEEGIIQIARSFGQELMTILLDWREDEVQITEGVVKTVAADSSSGKEVMALLLDRCGIEVKITEQVVKAARGPEVKITEEVVKAAAGNWDNGKEVMALLLDWRGTKVEITKEVVKVAAGNWKNGKEIMALLLNRKLLNQHGPKVEITKEVVKAAARNEYSVTPRLVQRLVESFDALSISKLLNQRGPKVKITEEVVKAAARNRDSGKEVMALLLNRYGDRIIVTPQLVQRLTESFNKLSISKLLNQRGPKVEITKEVVKGAAGNRDSGKEVMALLLDRCGDRIIVTPRLIQRLAESFNKLSISKLLNQHGPKVKITEEVRGPKVEITEKVVEAAARNWKNSKEVMALLLDQRGPKVKITEQVVKAAAKNSSSGKEVMALLLDQHGPKRGLKVKITEKVVKAAARNWNNSKEVMALLLDRRGTEVEITKEVVKVAARNWKNGKKIITLLLDWLLNQRSPKVKITKEVVKAAAKNWKNGKELLNQRGPKVEITKEVVKAAAGNRDSGKEVMALLLDQRGPEVKITEQIVKTAAGNWNNSKEVMALLLDQRGPEVKITEEVVKAAARNSGNGKEVIALLLDRRGPEVNTEEVVEAVAGNEYIGKEVMALLLDQRGPKVKITKQVVKAAARNSSSSKEVIALLLDQRGPKVKITEEVVKAAARNRDNSKEVMALLLDQRGPKVKITKEPGLEVKITEEVVKAAARNSSSGKEVIALLLDQRGPEVKITKQVVKAAAGNWNNGKEVMALLLDQRGPEVKITEQVVKAAAGNSISGKEVMALLLDQRGPEVKITEEVVKAAAGNSSSGKVMALLLDRCGIEVKITEQVVKAAAGNSSSGEVMALLLDQRGPEVRITEEVVKAAAGNRYNGKEVMALLLNRRGPKVKITEEVVKAAAGNSSSGKEVMALLLDQYGPKVRITEEVVKAAARNRYNGKEVMALLLD